MVADNAMKTQRFFRVWAFLTRKVTNGPAKTKMNEKALFPIKPEAVSGSWLLLNEPGK